MSHTRSSSDISEIIEASNQQEESASSADDEVSYRISGSPRQAFITNAFVAYTGRSVVGTFNPLLPQTKLNQILIGILGASTVVSTCLTQIPMARRISRNGGKKEVLFIIGSTLTGMVSLTVLSSFTDITTIDGFDWRYGTMLASGYLIGLGSGLFPLLVNSVKWASKSEQIPTIQSIYSAVVDSSSVTTPIIINSLGSHYGYHVPFGLYAGIIAVGGVTAIKFIQPTPYDQLKRKFSKERAKELALQSGQLETMIQDDGDASTLSFVKSNIRLCIDPRIFFLNSAMFATLGSFFVTETIFPTLLTSGYNIDPTTAVYASSIANLITILSRPVAGKIIAKWDNDSGGIKVFVAGCLMTATFAIPLTVPNLPQWAVYANTAGINVGFAFAIIPPLNIAFKWANPINENLENYNPDTAFGQLGTWGTFGGFILPIALGLLVDAQGEAGYQQYFFIIIAMMLAAAITVPLVDFNVMHTREERKRFFGKPMTFFGGICHPNRDQKYSFDDIEMAEEVRPPQGPPR